MDPPRNSPSPFEKFYKSNARNEEEMRKRRREDQIVIRKQKKSLLIEQRRFDRNNPIEPLIPSISQPQHSFMTLLHGGAMSGDCEVLDNLIHQIRQKQGRCTTTFAIQGIISPLASLYISHEGEGIQRKIAYILSNMNTLHSDDITDEENMELLVPRLCDAIGSSYAQRAVMRDLLYALSLLLSDSVVRRKEAIDSGIVGHIVYVNNLGYPDIRVTRSMMTLVAQLFHNISDFSPNPAELRALLPVVLSGLRLNDRDARGEALRACAHMCEWSAMWLAMFEENILSTLVQLLSQRRDLVELFYILKVIDTITQNTSIYTHYLLRLDLLNLMIPLLSVQVVGQDVCFILSNLVAEGQFIIDAIFDMGCIPQLASVLENADCETRKEASHALCRCICFTQNPSHLHAILELHVLQHLSDLLTVMDATLISQILEALQCLLAYGAEHPDKYGLNLVAEELEALGVYTKLEFLTESNAVEIHIKSFEIIELYFQSRLESVDDHLDAVRHEAEDYECSGSGGAKHKSTIDETIEAILHGHTPPTE